MNWFKIVSCWVLFSSFILETEVHKNFLFTKNELIILETLIHLDNLKIRKITQAEYEELIEQRLTKEGISTFNSLKVKLNSIKIPVQPPKQTATAPKQTATKPDPASAPDPEDYVPHSRTIVSLFAFPLFIVGLFGLHRFALGYKNIGLIQFLMMIPGCIFLLPPVINFFWVWRDWVNPAFISSFAILSVSSE